MSVLGIDLDRPPLSAAARRRLETELVTLREDRNRFAASINDNADVVGDVADRAEVLTQFDELDRVDARVEEVLAALARPARSVDPADDLVGIGALVTLRHADGASEVIVLGDLLEDDGEATLVTPRSPLGRAMLGRAAGETVTFHAPSGEVRVDIEAIERPAA